MLDISVSMENVVLYLVLTLASFLNCQSGVVVCGHVVIYYLFISSLFTISHKLLLNKIYRMTSDIKFTDLIGNMLSNRRYFVELNGQKSRWRNHKNGLPQGSVLSPVLFNIYTNDQPIHKDTRSFIYADDLCIATQDASFE